MNMTERIHLLEKFGVKPGLERISTLLHYLNNPEKA
jgi:folylpolyglutamate synthase/dihydropteroate synthase